MGAGAAIGLLATGAAPTGAGFDAMAAGFGAGAGAG